MCKHIVNTYTFREVMRVRKVSNDKSDLQGHSRSYVLVLFDRPHLIFCARLGVAHWNFADIFGVRKLVMSYRMTLFP